MKRFYFYERSKKAYAVGTTSEEAIYANIITKK
jgi:L-fucose mutarotase/ribose pyranase (RbsD/FucU family)